MRLNALQIVVQMAKQHFHTPRVRFDSYVHLQLLHAFNGCEYNGRGNGKEEKENLFHFLHFIFKVKFLVFFFFLFCQNRLDHNGC